MRMSIYVSILSINNFILVTSNNIRKIKTTIDNLFLEKQKVEKGDKPKKAKGGKLKARLRIEGENMVFSFWCNIIFNYIIILFISDKS